MDIDLFKQNPYMGILRGIKAPQVAPLVQTVLRTKLKAIEITMNTADAPALIERMCQEAAGRLMIGAGTVLSLSDLEAALNAGATFIVSPTLIPEIVTTCRQRQIPVFPGAFSPQEIFQAWQAGATMVKVFPAKFFGPDYIKEIKGPFHDIELMACGGVRADNVRAFLAAGASAVAFGGSIFQPLWLNSGDFAMIEQAINALIV
jgi:2-dehydro-3-deoxyphosphogluconate aldolase/(4S)-4-hydroxy-2-oxoglutarate aldolase